MIQSTVMIEFLDLCDDCLIKVFSYCDIETLLALSETCKRLKRTVETCHSPILPEYRSRAGMNNAVIKRFGRYIRQLCVSFEEEPRPIKIGDYCTFLAQTVVEKIRKFEIISDGIVIPPLELLAPILERLDVLVLRFQRYGFDAEDEYSPSKKTYTMDLAVLCPNLKELMFYGPHRFLPNCSSFSRLKLLTICSDYGHRYEIDEFLDRNSQLTQICFYHCPGSYQYIDFDNFAKSLVNLEKLRIAVPQLRYGPQSWQQQLGRLQKLKILRLDFVSEHLNEILANLTNLKELTSISVHVTYQIEVTAICQQQCVQIAKECKNLEFFYILPQFLKKVSWDRNSLIEFVRSASKLQAVHFEKLNFQYTADFIRELVEARKSANPNAKPLKIATDDEYFNAALTVSSFEIQN